MSITCNVVEEPMSTEAMSVGQSFIVESQHLEQLLQALAHRGYEVIGPKVCEGAIVYQQLTSIKDLPEGWTDEQQGGKYRLKRRTDHAWFGYVVGPHSWKKFLHPPVLRLWQAERKPRGFRLQSANHEDSGCCRRSQRRPSMRSSAFVPVNCTRSRFKTRYFCRGRSRTRTTRCDGRTRSS